MLCSLGVLLLLPLPPTPFPSPRPPPPSIRSLAVPVHSHMRRRARLCVARPGAWYARVLAVLRPAASGIFVSAGAIGTSVGGAIERTVCSANGARFVPVSKSH
jgi:hypothetical protein